jgi:hypothetical protein
MSSARRGAWALLVVLEAPIGLSSSRSQAQPPIMPPAMIDACKGLTQGTACQFQVGGKLIEGSCFPMPSAELACRPGPKAKRAKPKTA